MIGEHRLIFRGLEKPDSLPATREAVPLLGEREATDPRMNAIKLIRQKAEELSTDYIESLIKYREEFNDFFKQGCAASAAKIRDDLAEKGIPPEERKLREEIMEQFLQAAEDRVKYEFASYGESAGFNPSKNTLSPPYRDVLGGIWPDLNVAEQGDKQRVISRIIATKEHVPPFALKRMIMESIQQYHITPEVFFSEISALHDPFLEQKIILEYAKKQSKALLSAARLPLYRDLPYAREIVKTAAQAPDATQHDVFRFADTAAEPFAEEALRSAILAGKGHLLARDYLKELSTKPYFSDLVRMMVIMDPGMGWTIREHQQERIRQAQALIATMETLRARAREDNDESQIKNCEPALELAKSEMEKSQKMLREEPQALLDSCVLLQEWMPQDKRGEPWITSIPPLAKKSQEFYARIQKPMPLADRMGKVQESLRALRNYETAIAPAIQAFNEETGMHIECVDMSAPATIVFINTFVDETGKQARSLLPAFFTLTLYELAYANKEDILRQLRDAYRTDREAAPWQYYLWERPGNREQHAFDLPKKGKTGVVYIGAPGHLLGGEETAASAIQGYATDYGARILAYCRDHPKQAKRALEEKNLQLNKGVERGATRKDILTTITQSAEKSVDTDIDTLVIHYLMHGNEKGEFGASDGKLTPEELMAALNKPYEGKKSDLRGKPLLSLLKNVVIIADSCISGTQEERYASATKDPSFDQTDIPNLWIYTSSSKSTASYAGVSVTSSPLTSESMRGQFMTTPVTYYRAYYRDLMDVMRQRNPNLSLPLGTFTHSMIFSDLLARRTTEGMVGSLFSSEHSKEGQNMQGRYILKPKKDDNAEKKPVDRNITQTEKDHQRPVA